MKKLGYLLVFISVVSSCRKDRATEVSNDTAEFYCDSVTISFSNHIQPIFIQNCATSGCHNSVSASSGYVFETHGQLSQHSNMSPALKTMEHDPSLSPMPKFQPKLNDSLIEQIECWIAQGKLNN